jgi:hypothetical protein
LSVALGDGDPSREGDFSGEGGEGANGSFGPSPPRGKWENPVLEPIFLEFDLG